MSDRAGVALGVAAAVPVAVCTLAAGGMLLAGDERALVLETTLPGAVFAAGLVLSAGPAIGLLVRGRRRRRTASAQEQHAVEIATAVAAAAEHERANHRRFLARLDHELKNPLTAIRATAVAAQSAGEGSTVTVGVAPATHESTGSELPAGSDDAGAWRTIDAQAQKLSGLVRDLRKLAELETRPLESETVDVEALVVEAIEAVGQQHPAARARISFAVTRVPWPVPPLRADLDLLSLAIDNVLGNAVKYSTDGPIEVRLREDGGWAVLEVADAGRGVPTAELPSVFDELARAQNARDVSGSGIGLTLVATVMRRHGGDVSMRSVEGAGSVVTLRLPTHA
ncbi:sensor histidine kinase [Microbacterium oxydans]|uniref:sensor histidine kinase n=1 Tax=Microbacterium oxydans TaxID=82380 RepID=UPI00366F9EC7